MTDKSKNKQVTDWIKVLNLKPHPEGGFYSETYRNDDQCSLERYNKQIRSCSTAIYYLLKSPESPTSRFHRIKSDEMWHFYQGLPVIIHVLDEEKSSHSEFILHNNLDVNTEARPQYLIPHDKWFAAEILPINNPEEYDDYALCGCTVSPGFDYQDFEIAKRSYLISKFPNLTELITRLTPVD